MLLKLYRSHPDGMAVRGRLYVGETLLCNTLENSSYLIPALIYRVEVTMSPRFKRLLPILCQVPGRSGIRIHRGTKPEHSRGCILVPGGEIESYITDLLLKEHPSEIRLEIIEEKGGES